ncbi:hypothetical protein ATANTOWER_002129 [Ataeniobius toweri]|uniref:Adhesion G protein-coupled receptor F5-like n=1 Tax=Ataeniobius toweri TaxID=208326 RepID=A0ABU7CHS1_9TELE|nr:hypothetical protein [Ataeniobius toweri]
MTSSMTSSTPTTANNGPTTVTSKTVDTTTATSAVLTSTTTLPPLTPATGIDIVMSVKLDMTFIPDYNNKDSAAYKSLATSINELLKNQYEGITGFINVFMTGFRQGSVIVDFTVRTSVFNDTQMATANDNLKTAMSKEIASVLETGVPEFSSPTKMNLSPDVIYTGQTMTLTCDPSGFSLGKDVTVEWTFDELVISSKRHKISFEIPFTLEVSQVILADAGDYQCTLKGKAISFHQYGKVRTNDIKTAPNLQVRGTMFAECAQGKTVPLECCVQSPFKVIWFAGLTPLVSGPGSSQNCITYQYPMQSCTVQKEETFTCKVENLAVYGEKTHLTIFLDSITCNSPEYGDGRTNDRAVGKCEEGQTGAKIAVCLVSGNWKLVEDTCIVTVIKELLIGSEDLKEEEVPRFTEKLSTAVKDEQKQITKSSATISAIVGIVWRALTINSTAFMRHVAIVNTALSLLIADICFIIGASIAKNPKENPDEDYTVPVGPCSAATFFMHFFYLAMFFWMFVSSLLLLYWSVMVFSQMSKWTMFAIGLTVGYVCPLIIAVTTVAATAPGNGYVRENQACWLNWTKTKALLALVIPALTIVVFNILVIIVVLYKMLRRRSIGAQADEKQALLVILRCVAILTPLFGLTWSLGIGTMVEPTNEGIHIAFAFFNSLQGFFILVFGTLLDSKIRSLMLRRVPTLSTTSNRTRSTSAGISSHSGLNIFGRLRGRMHVYRLSRTGNSNNTNTASESFTPTH